MPPKRPVADSAPREDDPAKRARKSTRALKGADGSIPLPTPDLTAHNDDDIPSTSSPSTFAASDEEGPPGRAEDVPSSAIRGPEPTAAAPEPAAQSVPHPATPAPAAAPPASGPVPDPPVAEHLLAPAPATPAPNAPPTLADVRNLFSFIDYVPDETVMRLLPFARKFDGVNHRYALSQIPTNATWGTTSETDKFLCIDNVPVTIWAIGNTESPWFVDPQGEPHSRVNIGFCLPFAEDYVVMRSLYKKARPKRTDVGDVIYSARLMARYAGKGGKTNVYDATERFRAKSDMPLLSASLIGKRDIVMVESFLTRWKTDKQDRRNWTRWNVGLELQAVNLLYEVSPDFVEEEVQAPERVPDFDDDM